MNIIDVGSLALALISVSSAILLIWSSRKKLTKSRALVEQDIRASRVKMARDVIGLHSDLHWREDQLRMLDEME